MKNSGAQGVASSFKITQNSGDFNPPYTTITPKNDIIDGKYLVANYTDETYAFDFFCWVDYEAIPCNDSNPKLELAPGSIEVMPIQVPASSANTVFITGISNSKQHDNISIRLEVHTPTKPSKRWQTTKLSNAHFYNGNTSDFRISNKENLYTPRLDWNSTELYLRLTNPNEQQTAFLFSLCFNPHQRPQLIEQHLVELNKKSSHAISLEKKQGKCNEFQIGKIDKPFDNLTRNGKIIGNISADFSDRYGVDFQYALQF